MKGRPPKPKEILIAEKGKLYDVQRDRQEYTPQPKKRLLPLLPKYFDDAQKKEWRRLVRKLKNYGLYTAANEALMELYVVNMIMWRDEIEKDAPDMHNVKKLQDAIFKANSLLGMSSTDLAKLGSLMTSALKKKDEMEALLD